MTTHENCKHWRITLERDAVSARRNRYVQLRLIRVDQIATIAYRFGRWLWNKALPFLFEAFLNGLSD